MQIAKTGLWLRFGATEPSDKVKQYIQENTRNVSEQNRRMAANVDTTSEAYKGAEEERNESDDNRNWAAGNPERAERLL